MSGAGRPAGDPQRSAIPGHEGTEYATYLHIDDLLTLQQPLSPDAPDELLFIVVHQAYELWFKLAIHELASARVALAAGRPGEATAPLRRLVAVDALLLHQLTVLETMGPDGFLRFRDPLAPASGFQSRQFREIERVCADHAPEGIWRGFCAAAEAAGLRMPPGTEGAATRLASLAELYRDHADPLRTLLHQCAELLLDHDEAVVRWRHHHALMAAREIGTRSGTGGSPGVPYLESTLGQRFFPDLWAVRACL